MTTLFPTLLTTGLALAAAPILLHLLNLQQPRPVRWAAMQFLLESRAKNQAWINLKQWLLLAARVLAISLAGLMTARPSLTGGFAAWLPGQPTHVAVLLDDSYSMSDQGGQRPPWTAATRALASLAERADEGGASRITVVRSSRPDSPIRIASDSLAGFKRTIQTWRPTEHAGGLTNGLEALIPVAGQTSPDERCRVVVLSDFRQRDLQDPDQVAELLESLRNKSSSVTLAPCADRRHGNLTITGLQFEPSAMVADLELTATLTVTNNSAADVGRTTVRVAADGAPMPAVELGPIPAGGSATQSFAVRFAGPGPHRLHATLPEDAVAADNHRFAAVDLPAERRVLLLDGSGGGEGRLFATALRPSRSTSVGWQPIRRSADAPVSSIDLSGCSAVLVLDAARLPDPTAAAVQLYAEQGGGLLLVLGKNADRRYYNQQLFADSADPLLPVRLDVPTQTRVDAEGRSPSLAVSDHPALRAFGGQRSRFAELIRVRRRHTLLPGWPTNAVRIAAELETGAPLLLESTGGPGRVLCLMTSTARPDSGTEGWSNLARSPLFPVLVNELTAYIASPRLLPATPLVGDQWQGIADQGTKGTTRLDRLVDDDFVTQNTSEAIADWGAADEAGVYRIGEGKKSRSIAINVAPGEGDLSLLGNRELRQRFNDVDLRVVPADQLAGRSEQTSVALAQRIGMLLLGLLAVEQALAFVCSYHGSRSREGAAA